MAKSVNFDLLEDIKNIVKEDVKLAINTAERALNIMAIESSNHLRQGLSHFAGLNSTDKNYENSKKGDMPYAHTLMLQKSIGSKVYLKGNLLEAEVGSGGGEVNAVDYAKYLQGRNDDGIRPFLWYIDQMFNFEKFIELWKKLIENKNA